MSQYAKAPWVTVRNGGVNQLIESAEGEVIVYTIGSSGMRDNERAASARRIVACVNICEGIGTEELEQHSDLISAQLATEQSQRDELVKLMAELLYAAQPVSSIAYNLGQSEKMWDESIRPSIQRFDQARHAAMSAISEIAKAKGGAV